MKRNWTAAALSAGAASVVFAAAAMAQAPAPSVAGIAQATGTVSPAASTTATAVMTGTTTPEATRTVVMTGTTTPVASGTREATPVPTIVINPSLYQAGGTGNFPFANPAFERVWNRTDKPVAENKVSRTWFWGPGPNTPGLLEAYKEAPNGSGLRLVQYFDKSRMEVNNPNADSSQPFFVTNGLLTVELISGYIQTGEKEFVKFRPACIPMSGDFGDTNAPTYFDFQSVSNTQAGDHPSKDRTGTSATDTMDRNGKTGTDASKATVPGTKFVHFEPTTKHNIPQVFWDFLNSSGTVYNTNGQLVKEQLITPWFYASGLPISEPYWAKAKIRGVLTDVLIQAFERRALTYVPTNSAGFQVEMANIGQHYFDWRYRNFGLCPGTVPGTPTPPVPAATGTAVSGTTTPVATGTAVATGTVVATGTTTPAATGTAVASPSATATGISGTPQPIPVSPTPTVTVYP